MEKQIAVELSSPPARPWSRVDIVICVVAAVLAAAGAYLDHVAVKGFEYPGGGSEGWRSLPGLVALTLAGTALRRYADARVVGTVLLIAGVASALATALLGISAYGFLRSLPWAAYVQAAALTIWPLSIAAPLVFLPQVYPDGPLPLTRWRRVLVASGAFVSVATAAALVGELVSAGTGGCPEENIYCASNLIPMVASSVTGLSFVAAVVLGLAAWLHRWRHGGTTVRRQIGLLSIALLLPLPLIVVSSLVGSPMDVAIDAVLGLSWTVLVVAAILVAILRYDLYDVSPALRRAAAYVLLTAGLLVVFLAVYAGVLSVVTRSSSSPATPWLAAGAAALVILAADPVRRKLQRLLERKIYGQRAEPLAVIERLSDRVRVGDEPAVLRTVAGIVADAVRSPAVSIGVQRASQVEIIVDAGGLGSDHLVLDALHRGERVGELRVAPRSRRETFSRADLVLLKHLADQLGGLIYGFRQDNEVATQRRHVLLVAGEERERVARDLHDGVGPLLAGAGLAAEGLRRGLPVGSHDEAAAAQLSNVLRRAATQVREIAHGLQPHPLADEGLAAMIREHLATLNSSQIPTFDLRADVPRLSATIEQEVYLILLESVNNVVRHAHARQCRVDLRVDEATLHLVVRDDGIGLPRPYISGMGLTSMRTRATALGGQFELSSEPEHGTQLTVQVPVVS